MAATFVDTALLAYAEGPPQTSIATTSLQIPPEQSLCGMQVFGQFAHFDLGASHAFAFSPGLRLTLGN